MNRSVLRRTLTACLLLALAAPLAAFAEPGDMVHMNISGKVQISSPPMAVAIPAISQDVCTPKTIDVRALVTASSRNKNCAYTNYKQVGSTYTFHYACTGDQQLDGDGSFTVESGGVHGTIDAKGNMHGQATVVAMTYQGTRTGASCDYTPPAGSQ